MSATAATPDGPFHAGPWTRVRAWPGAGSSSARRGSVATVPMPRALQRRTGSWRAPALALAAFAAIFTFSTLVIGPALSGSDTPAGTAAPADGVGHHGHDDPTRSP